MGKRIVFIICPQNEIQLWTPTIEEFEFDCRPKKWQDFKEGSLLKIEGKMTRVISVDPQISEDYIVVSLTEFKA